MKNCIDVVITLDVLLLRASEGRLVRKETQAHLELQDPPVPEDPLEMTVQRVTR